MRPRLAERMRGEQVGPEELAVFFVGQAGFVFKNSEGALLALDLYLSDALERSSEQFRRMVPTLLEPEEVDVDLMLVTHNHPDHLDPDAFPIFARHPRMFFVGAPDCAKPFHRVGIPPERQAILRPGERWEGYGFSIRATFSDHGESAPEAVGYLIEVGGIAVWNAGDTGPSNDALLASLDDARLDVMIAPINGVLGNMNGRQTCELAAAVRPRLLIGAHFGMFAPYGGDPAVFLKAAQDLPAGVEATLMAPGEVLRFSRAQGVLSRETLRRPDLGPQA